MIKPYYESSLGKLYHGSCLDIMPELEPVDLVLTDPPYFLPASHYQTRKQFSRNFSDLGILEHFIKDLFKSFNRIVVSDGVLYIFCDGQSYPLFYFHLYPFCKAVRPLVWDKMVSINGYGWRHQHELIIYAERPEMKKIPTGDGDILKARAVKINDRIHPAEKPVPLIYKILEKHKGIALDPFFGSGTTAIAAERLGRNWIGIETSEEYCEIAAKRIESEASQLKLFAV